MSDAVDNAEVMLSAVSEKYKESGSCRLEASYARELGIDMIPLAVQKGYKPDRWLGLLLGARSCHSFCDCEDEDDTAFEKRVEPVVKEILSKEFGCFRMTGTDGQEKLYLFDDDILVHISGTFAGSAWQAAGGGHAP